MRAVVAACGLLLGCGRLDFAPLGDASGDVSADACDPSTQPVVMQELHTGELVIDAASTLASVPLALPTDRTILFTSVREIEPSPDFGNTLCQLSPDSITCVRNSAGTDYALSSGQIRVRWTTVTFSRGVTVQRGTANVTSTTPALVTLTVIDPQSSFALLGGGYLNTGNSWGTDEYMRARIVDAQTLEVGALATAGMASWQVISMAGARVERGVTSFTTSDLLIRVPIGAHEPTRSFALVSTTENSSIALGVAISMVTATVESTSTLRLERGLGGVPLPTSWEVITLPFIVEHGTTLMPAGVSSSTASLSTSATSTVALMSGQSVLGTSGGFSTYQTGDGNLVDMVGEAAATPTVSAGKLTLERGSSLGEATFPWSAIDFASCR